jgi:tetratricopeptide (TPR) repeat protein
MNAKHINFFLLIILIIAVIAYFFVAHNNQNVTAEELIRLDYENGYYKKVVTECDKELKNNPDNYFFLLYKGHSLYELGEYQEAIEVYEKLESLDSADPSVYENMSSSYHLLGQKNEALRCIDKALSLDPNSSDFYIGKGYILDSLEEYEQAIETMDQLLLIDPDNYEAYYIKGLAYTKIEEYDIANAMFNKGISLNPDYAELYVGKAWIKFEEYNYSDCIEYCNKMLEKFPRNADLIWYKADSYFAKQDFSNALTLYDDLLKMYPRNDLVSTFLAWQYYYLQDYENALVYTEKALNLNADNIEALELKKLLDEAQKPESERIANFVRENYLYKDKVSGFDSIVNEFSVKGDVDIDEINDFLNSIRYEEDYFTFLIDEQDYELMELEDMNSHINYDILFDENGRKTIYISFDVFTFGIANEFREIINDISDSENCDLIIDLRDNGGGLAYTTNVILDILLPECVTSYIIYRDGSIDVNNSDKNHVEFNHIYVFVNSNSASSSELLSLGLKKHLDNVTIVGIPTVGKGVGQSVFDEKKEKYMILLVNHYWNVKEINIQGMNIDPDIYVETDSIDVYFSSIGKQLY